MSIVFTPHGYTDDSRRLTPEALYNNAFNDDFPPDLAESYLTRIAKSFIDMVRRDPDLDLTRKAGQPDASAVAELLNQLPFVLGMEHVDTAWIEGIFRQIAAVFDSELAAFAGSIEEYIQSKNTALTVSGRVFFHLVETREEDFPFAFMATYSTKKGKSVIHLPLKKALKEYDGDEKALLRLLATVSRAAQASAFITELMESGELFSPLKFEPQDSYTFLSEVPLYEDCGVICRIPDFWKRRTKARVSVQIGAAGKSLVGMNSVLGFSPEIALGDTVLTREELEALLGEDDGLALVKGKWVEVNQRRIAQILAALDRISAKKGLTFAEAMRLQSGLSEIEELDSDVALEISNRQWLSDLQSRMNSTQTVRDLAPGADFHAELRHYQQSGLHWLDGMCSMGFGALLADDMGLGKTVQVLALLETLREQEAKTLLIVPTSLMVNWQKEAQKFTPRLRICVLHGSSREIRLPDYDLFITTYGMVAKMSDEWQSITWDLLILDEAQAIKNPGIKQTKAIKALQAHKRIAMSGTPIENRLGDLWSIFDFLNCGLLGTTKEFTEFSKKLLKSPQGYARLRDTVSPFILRRLKTDKSVISDLPDKNEILQYTTLTKKQVALYTSLVEELRDSMTAAADDAKPSVIQRRGQILAAILKLKQICNHPDQFTGQTGFEPKNSGKFEALASICETIRDKHESVLVFTQFREMCAPLSSFLAELFGQEGLVITGETPPKKRGEIVEQFNTEYVPYMVLSLKAGGVGLNLTAANHVVHFDRWWNPAVENQATDRAFRIGQTKDVMVHKFVTTGTIEEKIDKMIADKQKLSADIITPSTGEKWITELTDSEFMSLIRLDNI